MRSLAWFIAGWFTGWLALGVYCLLAVSSNATRVEEQRKDAWDRYAAGPKPGAKLAANQFKFTGFCQVPYCGQPAGGIIDGYEYCPDHFMSRRVSALDTQTED